MESLPVRRKSPLLRLRDNCPLRKLRRQTYNLSAANSSPIGLYWNHISPPTSNQPIRTVYSEPLPPLSRCQNVRSPDQSGAAADVHMEDENPQNPPNPPNPQNPQNQQNPQNLQNPQNQQNPENRAEDSMDLDDDFDPETGERAPG